MSASDSFPDEEKQTIEQGPKEVQAPPQKETVADEASPEAALPPEARGDVNGGPLGCCLGITIGLLLSLSIGIFSRFYADSLASTFSENLVTIVRILMALAAIGAAALCGYLGWRVGKSVYREYPQPAPRERRTTKSRLKKSSAKK